MDSIDAVVTMISEFIETSPLNRVEEKEAIASDFIGLRLFDSSPLIGVAAIDDPLFLEMRKPEAVGSHFRLPREWLPGASSVISYFLPFTKRVVESNRLDPEWPSPEWLHARIEGQRFINALSRHVMKRLSNAGFQTVVPALAPEFSSWSGVAMMPGREKSYTSNWSERHVAHVAGLGSFGLSAALITRKGTAGRVGSVVTCLRLPPTPRPYSSFDAYCLYCNACARRCPVLAISPEKRRKDKQICSAMLNIGLGKFHPRYGCGKCYVGVPCESVNPRSR
ncbi:MAG: epoxyqueuosine reductase [Planctomycetota bacterium]|nr:epoxyqueuosine reductase [Planctomycetota bacterium]